MSRLDYSKWDNLEISDDEDIECHPNIDKASFIRWRRAEIHRRRQERRDKIASFKAERVMNVALIKRLKHLEETQPIKDDATLTAVANDYRERGRAPDAERQEEGPSFDEMIAVLLLQIQDEFRAKQKEGSLDNEADWLAEKIREHRGKLEKRQEEIAVELPKLEREEQRILTVDNVCHEGFSRTVSQYD
jgi:cell division cycle protein 37